jgi:Fe-S-cluster-containing dehydrogenase component/DMSO reductase anchor subunit
MRKGFTFNYNKCVNCNACSAACILENGWTIHPRRIFTYNSETELSLPVINLSLACNHCENAVCMEGCPTSAYSRNDVTGAVILDELKCIGCKYCQWNCPYDAPKFDNGEKTISKCHLCYTGLMEGRSPACTSACPTGALSYGQLPDRGNDNSMPWFPDKKLNPAIGFSATGNKIPLKIVPEHKFDTPGLKPDKKSKKISDEVSLVIFSFLATLSVSYAISSFLEGVFPNKAIFISVLLMTGVVSLFHLGKKLRSWRSVTNLRHSPLSREIAAFITYSVICLTAISIQLPGLLLASSISGLILLLLIDSVYIYADRRRKVFLHSGQTFLSAMLIVSFLTGNVIPFAFIALIKLISSLKGLYIKKLNNNDFGIRYLRLAFLIVTGSSLILNISPTDLFVVSVFLTGELLDRVIFYLDFNPMNIKTLIEEQENIEYDEKKRG